MESHCGKQLRHGYAILELSERSFMLDYESLPLDCPDPHEAKTDLMEWGAEIFHRFNARLLDDMVEWATEVFHKFHAQPLKEEISHNG